MVKFNDRIKGQTCPYDSSMILSLVLLMRI